MTCTTITNGSHAVRINPNDGRLFSVHTCNNGETVLEGKSHGTKAGAERWARKVLGL